ncbi:hypothetical protein V496_00401 [Pseudogymnoascus sp. VKM F-4515 (FW-2607)]|nr:hypothetical protein V496_00401 [Pseudogymnoascus sp. VKM F-4515 (FW-2607)]KFY95734.1 hypothetical protein V498_03176 [Pseudogymnoascus sp. VKM F-4517 (FW-2822)]
MPAEKRSYEEMAETPNPFLPIFDGFRVEIDENHLARERVIKASRDVTALSKKAVRTISAGIPPKISTEVQGRFEAISELFKAMSKDLQGINSWRYQRQASPGIQEFIEALSFEHYLRTGKLVTRDLAMKGMIWDIPLTTDDYALGLFDLSGEIMRFAVTAIATTGSLPHFKSSHSSIDRSILTDLRHLRSSFEALDTTSCHGTSLGGEIDKKMETMVQSVEKVENAACSLIIRDHERPKNTPEPSDNN